MFSVASKFCMPLMLIAQYHIASRARTLIMTTDIKQWLIMLDYFEHIYDEFD